MWITDSRIIAQHLDTGLLLIIETFRIDAQLQQGADHAVAFLSTDHALLDLSAWQDSARQSDDDLLSGRHVRRTADDLTGIASDIDLANMQMIAVWMIDTAFHMSDHQIGCLCSFFDAFDLQSCIGDALSDLLDAQVADLHILTQPFF